MVRLAVCILWLVVNTQHTTISVCSYQCVMIVEVSTHKVGL